MPNPQRLDRLRFEDAFNDLYRFIRTVYGYGGSGFFTRGARLDSKRI